MRGSTVQIACPVCKTEYQLTPWGLMKLLRKPRCERCGASLSEALKSRLQPAALTPGPASGEGVCPGCGQRQEIAPFCKWCGASMRGGTRPQAPTGAPRLKFPWAKAIPAIVMFAIFLLVPVVSTLEIPQAYETSVAFLRHNQGLDRALGGRADWGPFPVFFWKETEGPHEAWRGSFFFLVKGPNATIVVCVDLRKAGQARGAWQIGDENFYLDTAGNRKPLPKEESVPKPPKPSRT